MLYVVILIVMAGAAAAVYYFFIMERTDAFARALQLAERGDYTDARGLVRAKLNRDPNDMDAHYTMARIYAQEGNEDSELTHLVEMRRVGKFSPEIPAPDVLNRIGEIQYARDHYRESFEAYQDTLKQASSNEEALAHLAFMAIGQGEFDVGETFFRKLVRVAPNVAEYHVARAVGLSMTKNKEASREFELGLALAPADQTAKFLASLHALKQGDVSKAREYLESLLPTVTLPHVMHIANRLATAVYYVAKDYDLALTHAERCLAAAIAEAWESEEYDGRLSVAYLAMLAGKMEKASENLLELEIHNPSDELVVKVSDFRMDMEEGVASLDKVSPRGFDFFFHMQDWLRRRFPEDSVYRLSGLHMEERFNVLDFFTSTGAPRARQSEQMVDPAPFIERFNSLRDEAFMVACENIIGILGYRIDKTLPYRDRDGADFVAAERGEKKAKALFRIRKWKNQPISDIFLRDMQNYMNENKANQGFVVAGARLTSGAEEALKTLKKITVINEYELGSVLQKVMK